MKFNFFLGIFCLLVLMMSIGDHRRDFLSLPNAGTTMPDKVVDSVVVLESALMVLAPAPTLLPRSSPLVVPVHYTRKVGEPKPSRLSLSKRIFTIYRWIDVLYARIRPSANPARPTKTLHMPTKVIVPVHPAQPTPSRHIPDDVPAYSPPSSAIDLAGLWDTYKLVIGWVIMTCFVVVRVFVRFLSREQHIDRLAASEASLPTFMSIIDIYCSLGFPPVTVPDAPCDSNLDNRDLLTPNESSSLALAGGEILEPAASIHSNGSVIEHSVIEHYADEPSTPSSSHSSIVHSPAEWLARFPPTGQVHSPRSKLWLQGLITRLQNMQREGNFYGRLYDESVDNAELEEFAPATSTMNSHSACPEHTPSSLSVDMSERSATLPLPAPTSFDSDLSLTAGHASSAHSVMAGMSTTVSQDLLYNQLVSWISPTSHPDDEGAGRTGGLVGMDTEGNVVRVPRPSSCYR
ncbi:hypothetical protein RSOL_260530, partial [Rhizoctonia solani AG-3 Rhs1AP]